MSEWSLWLEIVRVPMTAMVVSIGGGSVVWWGILMVSRLARG